MTLRFDRWNEIYIYECAEVRDRYMDNFHTFMNFVTFLFHL